jgi:kumamolisin
MSEPERVPLPGSAGPPPANARIVGPVDPSARLQVTVLIRPKSAGVAKEVQALSDAPVAKRRYPSRQEFAAAHGADHADFEKVKAFAQSYNLVVIAGSLAQRSITLGGTAENFAKAFGVDFQNFETVEGRYLANTGPVLIPADLAGIIEAVVGLDTRPHARPK